MTNKNTENVSQKQSLEHLHGALLIDKPTGPTSAEILRDLKRKFVIDKIGHAGTLDPAASGVLVVLLGKATRLQRIFLESVKEYEGEFRLGVSTDTDDETGIEISHVADAELQHRFGSSQVQQQIVQSIESKFVGQQAQVPPIYSAVKVAGQRSYDLARKGEEVELRSRDICVESLVLKFTAYNRLAYRTRVSKGTYIRSLARDIGKEIDVPMCVSTLRRTFSTPFSIAESVSLESLTDAEVVSQKLVSLGSLVSELPAVYLNAIDCGKLRQGLQEPLRKVEENQSSHSNSVLPLAESSLLAVFEQGTSDFKGLLESENGRCKVAFLI